MSSAFLLVKLKEYRLLLRWNHKDRFMQLNRFVYACSWCHWVKPLGHQKDFLCAFQVGFNNILNRSFSANLRKRLWRRDEKLTTFRLTTKEKRRKAKVRKVGRAKKGRPTTTGKVRNGSRQVNVDAGMNRDGTSDESPKRQLSKKKVSNKSRRKFQLRSEKPHLSHLRKRWNCPKARKRQKFDRRKSPKKLRRAKKRRLQVAKSRQRRFDRRPSRRHRLRRRVRLSRKRSTARQSRTEKFESRRRRKRPRMRSRLGKPQNLRVRAPQSQNRARPRLPPALPGRRLRARARIQISRPKNRSRKKLKLRRPGNFFLGPIKHLMKAALVIMSKRYKEDFSLG